MILKDYNIKTYKVKILRSKNKNLLISNNLGAYYFF